MKLSKCPKDLFVIWKEFEFGIDGIKTVKDFTATERRVNKFTVIPVGSCFGMP